MPYPCPIRALSLALPRALSRAPSVPHPCPIQWPSRALPPALSSALFVAPCALFVSLTEKGADLVDAALDAAAKARVAVLAAVLGEAQRLEHDLRVRLLGETL